MTETDIESQVREEELQLAPTLSSGDADAFPELSSRAVKDLLSQGVCRRCILRVFGIRGDPCSGSALDLLLTYHENHMIDTSSVDNQTRNVEEYLEYCCLCLGIMQLAYCDDKGSVVSKDSAYDFAVAVAELIKQDGHQIDEFSLEVSIPPLIQENERSVCSFMNKKLGGDPWFQRKILPQCVSLKDALKSLVTVPLEKMLDGKSTLSTLRIRLTYNHPLASTLSQNSVEGNQECKRRKTVTATSNGVKSDDFTTREASVVAENSVETSEDSKLCDQHKFPLEKVTKPCELVFQCNRTSIYFVGRYLKFSRNVSQSRWIIDDERMGYASVEELIGNKILPVCRGDSFKFHAAGREDIDVRMLGSGRPFLIEVLNARHVPGEEDVKDIERRINDSEKQLVRVKNLKVMDSQGWTMMREGEAEKQKQYAALVWISRPLEDQDLQSLTSDKEMKVLQKTPIRVLHRRSPLERERIIHWMRLEKIVGSSQYFLLHLCTQAGTYIKEFVHGDLGRTNPSIGSILGCRAEILQLDVTDVKMDCFLDEQGTS